MWKLRLLLFNSLRLFDSPEYVSTIALLLNTLHKLSLKKAAIYFFKLSLKNYQLNLFCAAKVWFHWIFSELMIHTCNNWTTINDVQFKSESCSNNQIKCKKGSENIHQRWRTKIGWMLPNFVITGGLCLMRLLVLVKSPISQNSH